MLLTGGSAFGLAAADGVTRWLEENGRGYQTPAGLVPIVPAAVIYDLAEGDPRRAPGPGCRLRGLWLRGRAASRSGAGWARGPGPRSGRSADGSARVAAGIGYAAARSGRGETVAALAVVNAFGDVIGEDGRCWRGRGAMTGKRCRPPG